MNVLYIDTSNEKAKIGIIDNNGGKFMEFDPGRKLFEVLTDKIDLLLKKAGLKKHELTHVAVFEGPGGFTSLRIGIVTANTVAFGLNIPVLKMKAKDLEDIEKNIALKISKKEFLKEATPFYGRDPNITKPKKCFS